MNEAEEAIRTSCEASVTDNAILSKLIQCKSSLHDKLDILNRLDEEILDLVTEEIENEIEHADIFKERVRVVMIDVDRAMNSQSMTPPTRTDTEALIGPTHDDNPPDLPPHSPTHSVGSLQRSVASSPTPTGSRSPSPTESMTSHSHIPMNRVKLPKLVMKKFNGDFTKWATFWDSFESSVHNNSSLSDVDKFNYLNAQLEGRASEAIAGLKLTSANYGEAISILKKRFGNKQLIITRHMDALLNTDAVASPHNLKGLRHLYDSVETQVRGLRALGVPSESYGSLSSVLMNKLPQELRLIVSREITDGELNLDALMRVTEREIDARERACTSSRLSQSSRNQTKDTPTAAAMVSGATTPQCCFCSHPHLSSACEIIVDPSERKRILMKAGRCFVCLRKYHRSRECRSTMKCSKCNGRHHVSLCARGQSAAQDPSRNLTTSNSTQQLSLPQTHSSPPISSVTYVNARVPVLLQTAKTHVHKIEDPCATVEVRVLFNSGSQRSYVTNRVKTHLSLNTEHIETMLIKTFGSDKENKQECGVVRLGMGLKNGTFEMSLFTVPFICEPLSTQSITCAVEKYSYLSNLELADPPSGDEELNIDILIGSEYYWKLVTGEIIHGDDGPTAVHTKLGWVLSGPLIGIPRRNVSINLISTHSLKVGTHPTPRDLDDSLGIWRHLVSKKTNVLFMRILKIAYPSKMEDTKFAFLGRNHTLS